MQGPRRRIPPVPGMGTHNPARSPRKRSASVLSTFGGGQTEPIEVRGGCVLDADDLAAPAAPAGGHRVGPSGHRTPGHLRARLAYVLRDRRHAPACTRCEFEYARRGIGVDTRRLKPRSWPSDDAHWGRSPVDGG